MLTKEMHGHIAIIVVKAVVHHAPFIVDETSTQYLVHSIKQVIFLECCKLSSINKIKYLILF